MEDEMIERVDCWVQFRVKLLKTPPNPWTSVQVEFINCYLTDSALKELCYGLDKKTTNIKALSELMSIEPNEEEVSSHNPISEYPSKVEIFEILTMIESVLGKTNINNLMKEI